MSANRVSAASTVPATALPEYKQGEDQSLAHIENPTLRDKVDVAIQGVKQTYEQVAQKVANAAPTRETVDNTIQGMKQKYTEVTNKMSTVTPPSRADVETTLQGWKEKLEEMTNRALEKISSMIPAEKKESMANTWHTMNNYAEGAVTSIKDYVKSSKVGQSAIEYEQWMEKEATAAQRRIEVQLQSYYNQYFKSTGAPRFVALPYLKELTVYHNLKHVQITHDASAPMIDKKLVLKKVDRKPFLAEIKKGYKLKHVNTRDGSKPVLDKNLHLRRIDRKSYLNDIKKGFNLKHTQIKHDASKPFLA